jgi:hypothetical protein
MKKPPDSAGGFFIGLWDAGSSPWDLVLLYEFRIPHPVSWIPIEIVLLVEPDIDLMAASLPTAWALSARPETGVIFGHDRLYCQNPVSLFPSRAERVKPRDARRSQLEDFSLVN